MGTLTAQGYRSLQIAHSLGLVRLELLSKVGIFFPGFFAVNFVGFTLLLELVSSTV
jgi:hypothetical protein